jgi:hypothetical protein
MNAIEALLAVRAAGGSVAANGTALTVTVPADLPVPVWDALTAHKAILLDLLTPRVTYAELAAHEEREAIQAEAEAPAAVVAFDLPRPARRCRLIHDAEARDPHRGLVTMPAGIEGWIVDIDEIGDGLSRINLDWNVSLARRDGHDPVVVLIDGRARVLDTSALAIEGDPRP